MTVVRVTSLLELPPRKSATSIISNTAPPTTHTQGWVYHSVVVVELELLCRVVVVPELSCAPAAKEILVNKKKRKYLQAAPKLNVFMFVGLNERPNG